MRTRILEYLHAFGKFPVPEKQKSLFDELCQEIALSPEQLSARAAMVLKQILHNYAFFEISTIDKFNHKIIKTFARDLHLSQGFEVELDTDLLLEEAVSRLLERTGLDEQLTQVLIAFSLEKIDADKSWNIAFDLKEIGKLLFQENHSSHVEGLRHKSLGDLQEIQKNLASTISSLKKRAQEKAQKALQEIQGNGFEFEDFPSGTLPNHFKKISDGVLDAKTLYNNQLERKLVENNILYAKDERDSSTLSSIILALYLDIKKTVYQLDLLKNIYGNIVPMTVLNEIAKEIKNIELERDIIPISSLNSILSKEIRNQPVPFIYERLGEKYRHYFVDEFQDTSKMQWDNLVPLIGNALESENERNERGSLFLVGDVKQAIYRWRGGRAEQFLNLINSKTNPFAVEPSVYSLDTNWRSFDEIVKFNNTFFSSVAPVLENESYRNLFLKNSHQKTNEKPGGFVQLAFLDKDEDNKDEIGCQKVLETINNLISEHYNYEDICVLVRDNKKGVLAANFLVQHGIPIISSDALLLCNNEKVAFLVAVLRIFENRKDLEAAYLILRYLNRNQSDKHKFISENLEAVAPYLFKEYGFDISQLTGQSVSVILENAIAQFHLANDAGAHVFALMDEVLDVERKKGASVHAFLNYWEVKKDSLSVAAPAGVNAVNIMTIHKAKGLEFPFVIFPFANAILDDKWKKKKLWVKATEEERVLGLDEFLLNANKQMLEYGDHTAQKYIDEEHKTVMDSLNVLYVALTRAIKGLYIFTEKGKPLTQIEMATTYGDLFQWYITAQGISETENGIYSFGAFPTQEKLAKTLATTQQNISYISRGEEHTDFIISTKSGRMWDDERLEAITTGNLIHFALSKIKTAEEVPNVIQALLDSGDIPPELAEDIGKKILDVVNHPVLKRYYSHGVQVMNEQEILTRDGNSFVPDRISISENRATIIDYKTGIPMPKHRQQLIRYRDLIKDMGFETDHAIIVYIDQEINPVFV